MRKLAFYVFNAGHKNQSYKKMNLLIKLSVFILSLLFEGEALAGACNIFKSFKNDSISFGTVNVSGSLPIGSIIKEVRTSTPNAKMGACDGHYYYGADLNYSSDKTNISDVYKTNLDGVGIKVSGLYSNTIPDWRGFGSPNLKTTFGYFTSVKVQLIKTGDIKPGVLNNGKLASFKWQGTHGGLFYPVIVYMSGVNKVNVNSCTLNNNGIINVTMDKVKKSDFGDVGSTAGKKKFNIGLFCEKDALIQISFSPPAEGSPDRKNGIINIKKQAGGAEGVSIQLLYDDNTPVEMNRKKVIEKYANAGIFNISLTSQYYKQSEFFTGGKVDGYVTFTITHQ